MCSWILMSIEYQIITLSLCLGALSLCGVRFPPILFHNVHNVSWMVLPMFSISHSHMGEYSWQWPCQCSNVHGWSCQSSWSSMMFFSSCCFSPRTAAAMSAAGALKIGRTLEIWGYMVVMVSRVILMMQFLVKMDSDKYSTLAHLAPITWTP